MVSAAWVGSSGPAPGAGKPTPVPPPTPASVTVKVGDDGAFSTPYELTAGRWTLTVTASSPEGKTASLTRNVTVAYKGVNVVVTIKAGARAGSRSGSTARSTRCRTQPAR